MSFLSGGSKSKSESGNKSYPYVTGAFGKPGGEAYGNALGGLSGVLGSNPQQFWDQGGGEFILNQGLDNLSNKYAAMGLNKSGAAMKAMEGFRQGTASTYLDNWLGHMNDLGKLGLGGGGLMVDAGQWSKSSSKSSEGLGGLIGSIATAVAASDRRLKTNIEEIGLWDGKDSLKRYRWNWKSDPHGEPVEGVIADEVEQLRPHAFIPNFRGEYAGVNYGAL